MPNTNFRFKSVVAILLLTMLSFSCRKKEGNLDEVMQDLIELGYHGKMERPSGAMEMAALSFLGIDDYLILHETDTPLAVIQFKSEEDNISEERLESLLKMALVYTPEENREELLRKSEDLHEHSYRQGKLLVVWMEEKPEKLLQRLARAYN